LLGGHWVRAPQEKTNGKTDARPFGDIKNAML
jgi:hypothetical protein